MKNLTVKAWYQKKEIPAGLWAIFNESQIIKETEKALQVKFFYSEYDFSEVVDLTKMSAEEIYALPGKTKWVPKSAVLDSDKFNQECFKYKEMPSWKEMNEIESKCLAY